jgi:hypothetical protein
LIGRSVPPGSSFSNTSASCSTTQLLAVIVCLESAGMQTMYESRKRKYAMRMPPLSRFLQWSEHKGVSHVAILLAVLGILVIGCSKTPASAPPSAPPYTPSAFSAWCHSQHFGIKSPLNASFYRNENNSGFVQAGVWIPSKTEQEAKEFLDSTFADLGKKAVENGCELLSTDDKPPSDGAATLKYRTGRITGTLKGHYELRDTPDRGQILKQYWIDFHLIEELDSK